MLFAASARQRSARAIRGLSALLLTALLSVPIVLPARATDTIVQAEVRDSRPATLTVTTAIEGKTVRLPTVLIEGAVHNVTQIIVYVNNVYNTSMPLATGASTYIVAFGVTSGTHEVQISGIDAYANTEVKQTVRFTYAPIVNGESADNPTGGVTASPVDDYVNQTIDVSNATKDDVTQKVSKASSSGPLSELSDVLFNAFKSVDLISATDGTGVDKMVGRFTLVSAGLAASVFPWSAYVLVEKLRFIPHLAAPNGIAMGSMRIVGIALMLIPFIFIH